MPNSAGFAAVINVTRTTPDGAATGTINVQGSGTGAATGTIHVSRTRFLSYSVGFGTGGYAAPNRDVGASVTIGGTDFSESLDGPVEVTESLENYVVIRTARLQLVDERLAYAHASSISTEEQTCTIDFRVGPPGYPYTWRAMTGYVAPAANDEPFRPAAQLTVRSWLADLLASDVCLSLQAFHGLTDVEVLLQLATSAGYTLTIVGGPGRVRSKAIEWNGVTFGQKLSTLCELNGWIASEREANVLELVPRSIWGGAAEDPSLAAYTFSESDGVSYLPFKETPPSEPETEWTISGSEIPQAIRDTVAGVGDPPATLTRTSIETSTDSNGNVSEIRTTITTVGGVETRRLVEEWETFQADGVALGPSKFQMRRRIITDSSWFVLPSGLLSNVLLSRTTDVYEMAGIPNQGYAGDVFAPFGNLWTSGGFYTTTSAFLLLISRTIETNTYGTTFLERSQKDTYTYHASYGSAYPWGDGRFRAQATATFDLTERDLTIWTVTMADSMVSQVKRARYLSRWIVKSIAAASGGWGPVTKLVLDDNFETAERELESWELTAAGDVGHTLSTTLYDTLPADYPYALLADSGAGIAINPQTVTQPRPAFTSKSDYLTGDLASPPALPTPPVGSASSPQPQYQQEVFVRTVDVPGLAFRAKPRADFIAEVEDGDEAEYVARLRIMWQYSRALAHEGLILPELRCGDPVAFTNESRAITTAVGGVLVLVTNSIDPVTHDNVSRRGAAVPHESMTAVA